MRIVSLLPSATEILCGLGLRHQLVGVSHECDFPNDVEELPKVTTTLMRASATSREIDDVVREQLQSTNALYSLDMPLLTSLAPDLIVTQSLCDVCAVAENEVQAVAKQLPSRPRIVNLEPTCLEDLFVCIAEISAAADCVEKAEPYIARLRSRVERVSSRTRSIVRRPRVMLLEWIDPPFSAGHWTPELVTLAGGREEIGVAGQRSVFTPWKNIVAANPEVLVVACCGFDVERTKQDLPILRSYPGWESLSCVTSRRVYVVDGSAYFSRPGPRLVDSLEILAHLLHPQVHPALIAEGQLELALEDASSVLSVLIR